jgi:competence ComEA-like helix-hairpin-helix protein
MMQRLVLFVLLALVVFAPMAAGPVVASDSVSASTHVGDKVNINTADVKELMTLTGVGHNLAEKIVKFRDEHGQFKRPHDLRKVDGVGEALWEKNRERIVVK